MCCCCYCNGDLPIDCKGCCYTDCDPCNECPKVRARFGLAWIRESPCCPCPEPIGWEVNFCDTPSRVEQRCQELVKWISCPPLPRCDPCPPEEICNCVPRCNPCAPRTNPNPPCCNCKTCCYSTCCKPGCCMPSSRCCYSPCCSPCRPRKKCYRKPCCKPRKCICSESGDSKESSDEAKDTKITETKDSKLTETEGETANTGSKQTSSAPPSKAHRRSRKSTKPKEHKEPKISKET